MCDSWCPVALESRPCGLDGQLNQSTHAGQGDVPIYIISIPRISNESQNHPHSNLTCDSRLSGSFCWKYVCFFANELQVLAIWWSKNKCEKDGLKFGLGRGDTAPSRLRGGSETAPRRLREAPRNSRQGGYLSGGLPNGTPLDK